MNNIFVFLCSPFDAAVGRCVANVAEVLAQTETVIVVAGKQHPSEKDTEQLGENLTVVRRTPPYMNKPARRFAQTMRRFRRIGKRILAPTCIDGYTVSGYCEMLEKIVSEHGAERVVLIPTCTPFELVVACARIKRNHPAVLFMPYLFDEFSQNRALCYGKRLWKLKFSRNLAIEQQTLAVADRILHMPVWTKQITMYHPAIQKRCVEVEHPLLLKNPHLIGQAAFGNRVVYAGVVDKYIRDPQSTLRLAEVWIRHDPTVEFHFYSYGNAQAYVEQYAARYPQNIHAHGKVPHETVLEAMRGASVLLSIGNANTAQMPSKIFEYLSYAKPIVHVCTSESDRCVPVLEEYPSAVVVPANRQEWDTAEFLAKIDRVRDIEIQPEELYAQFCRATPEYTANLFKDLSQTHAN